MTSFLALYIIGNFVAFFILCIHMDNGVMIKEIAIKHLIFCIVFLPATLVIAVLLFMVLLYQGMCEFFNRRDNAFGKLMNKRIFKE